jgi:outer membrane protein
MERALPKSLDMVMFIALLEHPGTVAALHQVDTAEHLAKVTEGDMLPTLSVAAQVCQQHNSFMGAPGTHQVSAAASGTLNMPIYQDGVEYAPIRHVTEQLAWARFNDDLQRDSVPASLVANFDPIETAKTSIVSDQAALDLGSPSMPRPCLSTK